MRRGLRLLSATLLTPLARYRFSQEILSAARCRIPRTNPA